MSIFKLGGSVLALVTGLGGYTSFKYDTTSPCAAAEKAIRDEMPKIIDDLAATDLRFKALKVGGALFGGVDTMARGVITELAAKDVAQRSGVECGYMVVRRELDSAGFRQEVGARMADQLAARLAF